MIHLRLNFKAISKISFVVIVLAATTVSGCRKSTKTTTRYKTTRVGDTLFNKKTTYSYASTNTNSTTSNNAANYDMWAKKRADYEAQQAAIAKQTQLSSANSTENLASKMTESSASENNYKLSSNSGGDYSSRSSGNNGYSNSNDDYSEPQPKRRKSVRRSSNTNSGATSFYRTTSNYSFQRRGVYSVPVKRSVTVYVPKYSSRYTGRTYSTKSYSTKGSSTYRFNSRRSK